MRRVDLISEMSTPSLPASWNTQAQSTGKAKRGFLSLSPWDPYTLLVTPIRRSSGERRRNNNNKKMLVVNNTLERLSLADGA